MLRWLAFQKLSSGQPEPVRALAVLLQLQLWQWVLQQLSLALLPPLAKRQQLLPRDLHPQPLDWPLLDLQQLDSQPLPLDWLWFALPQPLG